MTTPFKLVGLLIAFGLLVFTSFGPRLGSKCSRSPTLLPIFHRHRVPAVLSWTRTQWACA